METRDEGNEENEKGKRDEGNEENEKGKRNEGNEENEKGKRNEGNEKDEKGKRDERNEKGLIHCYTGDGKGKTTAAVGLAVRAAGSGKRVVFAQFLKDGSSSEISVLDSIPLIHCVKQEQHFGFYRTLSAREKQRLKEVTARYFQEVTALALREQADLLVLDELMAVWNLKLLSQEDVLRFLDEKPEGLELVVTGRDAPEDILSRCDYVTEMNKRRHPYDRGVAARRGIEY